MFLQNIDLKAVKKFDELVKEKDFSLGIFKRWIKKEGGTEKRKDDDKGEKRNHKMDFQNFLHGIMEHILKKRNTTQEMER